MEKFAEDERLEQMNAQKRRMKELEYKREIERLWQEKLSVYRAQREIELEEKRIKEEEDKRKLMIIEMEKERLYKMKEISLKFQNIFKYSFTQCGVSSKSE